jgi:hypothetical protein
MLVAHTVERAPQPGLEVAEDLVAPWKDLAGASGIVPLDSAIVAVAGRLCSYPNPFEISGQEVDNIVQYAALDLDSPRHIIPDPVA